MLYFMVISEQQEWPFFFSCHLIQNLYLCIAFQIKTLMPCEG